MTTQTWYEPPAYSHGTVLLSGIKPSSGWIQVQVTFLAKTGQETVYLTGTAPTSAVPEASTWVDQFAIVPSG